MAKKKIRFAVVGLGHIAQNAVLPAFENTRHAELAALVSGDPAKQKELGERYRIDRVYAYNSYDQCLASGDVDAVYIALPNDMHCDYAVRAARAGVHVLCEKPMAVTEQECERMIDAAREKGVKLMIAYRLHFEQANLKAIQIVNSGELGQAKLFNSLFTMQVQEGNIRLRAEHGGGTLYDIGIYCINAVRHLFRSEPVEVLACSASTSDERFREADEMTSAILRFPGERLASFTCSFGASDVSTYQVVGSKGHLRLEPAYDYAEKLQHFLTIDGKTRKKSFRKRDQFGAEIDYFSRCILDDVEPEPSGQEGLIDVKIIRALYRSAQERKAVRVEQVPRERRPSMVQEVERPPVSEPELVHAHSPHQSDQ